VSVATQEDSSSWSPSDTSITLYSRYVTTREMVASQELAFNFRSGRLCLAFVATVGERWRASFERLRQPADLSRWYREAGLVDVEVPVTSPGLRAARELREAIYGQARRVIAGGNWSRADEAVVNAAAAHPSLVPVLRSGSVTLVPPPRGAQLAALSTVARDAIDMFASVDPGRLRECESGQCGLLFVDTSRPGKRRWCSSEACGGKVRAASYRQRVALESG
jgi:predicted RNA-binding Zn ribbon-like protein